MVFGSYAHLIYRTITLFPLSHCIFLLPGIPRLIDLILTKQDIRLHRYVAKALANLCIEGNPLEYIFLF